MICDVVALPVGRLPTVESHEAELRTEQPTDETLTFVRKNRIHMCLCF